MEKCLETNKICDNSNKLCKVCKLDNCKNTFKTIEEVEEKQYKNKIENLKAQLSEECRNCNLLQIINLNKEIVYCPYRTKGRCVLNETKKKKKKVL